MPTPLAFTVFLSAFLLFLVQPLIGKVILPWFGGTPAVWNTCMVYFQSVLVGGYAYSHYLAGRLEPVKQTRLHLAVLGSAVLLLGAMALKWGVPLIPDESLRPVDSASPVWRIVVLLSASVGLPYFVLASTGPLLQAWFARLHPRRPPYRLYALSNIGSLLALFAYPFAVEPLLSVRGQGIVWALGFVTFAASCALVALRAARQPVQAPVAAAAADRSPRPSLWQHLLWVGLAACASVSLLATTNRMSNEVAPVPFLWILPLSLYLLTFVLCFDSDRWYRRGPVLALLFVASLATGMVVLHGSNFSLAVQVTVLAAGQFLLCMACHGELARQRPSPAHLTSFFLMVSIGGAVGGAFVSLVAPMVFDFYAELPLSWVAGWLLVGAAIASDPASALRGERRFVAGPALGAAALITAVWMGLVTSTSERGFAFRDRNFYGVLRVKELKRADPADDSRMLVHGHIEHGAQYLHPDKQRRATCYFWEESGVGLALKNLRKAAAAEGRPLRVGIIGLGIGVLASYGEKGDVFRLYEIDPEMIRLAEGAGGWFSFLSDSPATIEVVEGDGRNSLEAELRRGARGNFDLLVLDAYSGDAIPSHLLTRESVSLYLRHLRDGRSMLAFHTTNNHLDVRAVVERLATELKLAHRPVDAIGDPVHGSLSRWDLLATTPEVLDFPELAGYRAAPPRSPPVSLWTDDYRNMLEILGSRPFVAWNEEEQEGIAGRE